MSLPNLEHKRTTQGDNRHLLVLYGSQTGTAEDVAQQISRGARRLHFSTEVASMDSYQQKIFEVDLVIFVCSTTGQGTEPQNMTRFWKALRRADLPNDFFYGIKFTIFGLGDSSYPKFNWVAKKLYRRLLQIGAECFYLRGEADDQNSNGVDSTLLPWLDGLWKALLAARPLPDGVLPIPLSTCLPPTFKLKLSSSAPNDRSHKALNLPDTKLAQLTKNQRLTAPQHWQDTRHFEFELSQHLDFKPGSVCEILPQNPEENVVQLLDLMKWASEADQIFELSRVESLEELPSGWTRYATLREIFRFRLDLSAQPTRSFFEWLSYFSTNPTEAERLREFCSPDGQDDLYEYVKRPRRTILEVLSEFKSAKIPLDYIHDLFPQIRPRQFSIASSSKAFTTQIHLLVAVVNYKTRLLYPRKGLCTNWLSNLELGTEIELRISSGCFNFPHNSNEHIICIGPGTGIAPFRSLIQERALEGSFNNLVIFGCRNEKLDFYYRDEWNRLEEKGVCRFHWAASRDQAAKRYVQHVVEDHANDVWNLIGKQNALIFISGSAGKMPEGVKSALKRVCMTEGAKTSEEADQFIAQLEVSGRLQEETWS